MVSRTGRVMAAGLMAAAGVAGLAQTPNGSEPALWKFRGDDVPSDPDTVRNSVYGWRLKRHIQYSKCVEISISNYYRLKSMRIRSFLGLQSLDNVVIDFF